MGEIAAIITAICWTFSSVIFTSISKDAGAVATNRVRLVFAFSLLLVAHVVLTGRLLPLDAAPFRWIWLGISGIIGLVVGDTLLFKSYALIGNRLGSLLMAGVPVFSSVGALIFLGEKLALATAVGIALCVCGISVVVLERQTGNLESTHHERRQFIVGVLCGLGGALGQAAGIILTKKGLSDDFPSISGVVIRMLVALVFVWAVTIAMGQVKMTVEKFLRNPRTLRDMSIGSLIGPFMGIWLSQIAIQYTYVGIASTLMALTPIFLLPVARWYYKEKVSLRAVMGTLIALAGVAVIFL
jgi:drug/metabolite transporter (DMT)-like permease